MCTGTVESVDASPLSSSPDVVVDPDVLVPVLCESVDELCVPPVTEEPPGRVADGSEPTVETGPEPDVVEPEGLPDDPEFVPAVDGPDDEVVDSADVVVVPVEVSVDEVVDPEDELDDSEELDDESESLGAANAVPMPPVPTKPTTPSENARAPNLNACFCEFIHSPNFGALDP